MGQYTEENLTILRSYLYWLSAGMNLVLSCLVTAVYGHFLWTGVW